MIKKEEYTVKTFLLCLVGFLAVASGCAIQPKLEFYKLDSNYEQKNTGDKLVFKMPSPVVVVSMKEDTKDITKSELVFTSSVIPRKEKKNASKIDMMYAVKPHSAWYLFADYKKTITYQQNSLLLKSFTTELTDNRTKYIQAVGGIVAAAIPIALSLGPGMPTKDDWERLKGNLPYTIDIAECFGAKLDPKLDPQDATKTIEPILCEVPIKDGNGDNTSWNIIIVSSNPNNPKATVSYEDFFTKDGNVSTAFPVPDCKEGFVYLEFVSENVKNRVKTSPITFANPTRLTTVPIPEKGTITYHPVCSADTSSASADMASPLELGKTTMDQVKAAKDAYDKAKK